MGMRAIGYTAGWRRLARIALVALPLVLVACGKDTGESGVKVIVTYAPATPTSVQRSLTPIPALPTPSPVAFSPTSGTITNITSSQLMAGVKARVKDSADGLSLRAAPSTKANAIETLAAGTSLNVLADPQDAEGRTWVKVSHGNNEGYVAAEFIERVK